MTQSLKVTFDDATAVAALERLRGRCGNLAPLLTGIGEDLTESSKHRFSTATAPDGTPWAPNTEVTILQYLGATKGNFRKKDGKLSAKGAGRVMAKKPLTGETKMLGQQIAYRLVGNTLEVGSTMIYSAVQQFGAKKGSLGGGAPWGDIPARPFLGISPEDGAAIEQSILDYLEVF